MAFNKTLKHRELCYCSTVQAMVTLHAYGSGLNYWTDYFIFPLKVIENLTSYSQELEFRQHMRSYRQ